MPKSSANVPASQPSIDRLDLTTASVRSGVGASTPGACVPCFCTDAEASSLASLLFSCWADDNAD